MERQSKKGGMARMAGLNETGIIIIQETDHFHMTTNGIMEEEEKIIYHRLPTINFHGLLLLELELLLYVL